MKHLIVRFTLPLTLLSFAIFTRWWYGLAIDAKDVYFYGFPLIYKCEGFHTSLSTQYFVLEMLIDLITYFVIALLITWLVYRFWKFKIPKAFTYLFWIGFGIAMTGFIYFSIELDDRFLLKRNFDVKIFHSGFTILEQHSTDREKYSKELKEWN